MHHFTKLDPPGLIITGVNIVAGLIIGIAQFDMELADAARTFTILTVGDGLVSQIPALLISTATGVRSPASTSVAIAARVSASAFYLWGRDENFFEWASSDILFVTLDATWRPRSGVAPPPSPAPARARR